MKGLIIKDFFAVKRQTKAFLILFLFYVVYAVVMENVSMLGTMISLVATMLPITSMSYDEYYHWDKYILSMPVSRKTVVLSKYLFGIFLNLIGLAVVVVISTIIVFISQELIFKEVLIMTLTVAAVALLFLAIILPLLFKFGVEKGRMLMMLVFFVPGMLVMLLAKTGMAPPSEQTLKLLAYAAPIILIAVLFISIKISIAIYNKKEF